MKLSATPYSAVPAANVDPRSLDDLDDAQLDELPFGVVCVDDEGTILRYNIAEARLARLDRRTVIGRNFFLEVAPCTDTPEFKGRFDRFIEHEDPENVQFNYVFDFKFGAHRVAIEFAPVVGEDRFYIVVTRIEFDAPRPEATAPAPRQAELLPAIEDVGALRDERGQRVVQAPMVLLDALMRTCNRVAPEAWRTFCLEWGISWGRRLVIELEADCLEGTSQALTERPFVEAVERLRDDVLSQGWGELGVDFSGAQQSGALQVSLERSALVVAARVRDRRCHLMGGMLAAFFSHLAGRRLHAEEVACAAAGHPRCEFMVVGTSRQDLLRDAAVDGKSIDEIHRELRGQHA